MAMATSLEPIMPWIQTRTEVFLVQMEKSMPKMSKISLNMELLAMLLLLYLKQFRYIIYLQLRSSFHIDIIHNPLNILFMYDREWGGL